MTINHVLAVIPVADIAVSRAWYERLFGREPDNTPMEWLVEWRLTGNGWLQVTVDADRAGRGQLNLAVDDLAAHLAGIATRGVATGEIQPVDKGVEISPVTDPDGNVITFIGDFRVAY